MAGIVEKPKSFNDNPEVNEVLIPRTLYKIQGGGENGIAHVLKFLRELK